jgi:hypothetical protein
VEGWTSKYASTSGGYSSYDHETKLIYSKELVHFDMAVFRDGVLGGQGGAIYRRWKKDDSAYDPEIAGTITYTRWLQIKRHYMLCDNETSPKRGMPI